MPNWQVNVALVVNRLFSRLQYCRIKHPMREKNTYFLIRLKIVLLILSRGKISIKKLLNLGHSWFAHMMRLRKTSRLPFMMNFELWNECNAQCTFCRTKDGDIYNLNPETNPSLAYHNNTSFPSLQFNRFGRVC